MTVTPLNFPDMVQRFAAQARASAATALDFTVGSLFRVIAEAQATVGLWIQWQILDVLRQTRLATSIGTEVDSFVGDFQLTRLPASLAGGLALFSRNTVGLAAFIPVGAGVRTTDGTQSFMVVADTTNPAWTGAGYAVGAMVASLTVPVQAMAGGAAGNVLAGSVTVLTTAIPGIDLVTNPAPFAGGLDAESDDALRYRFQLYIASLSRGTEAAALYAVASVRQGLSAKVVEAAGSYTVVVDDGSGAPPSALLDQVYAACDAYRPLGITLYVQPPTELVATVSMVITAAPGYVKNALIGQVATALLASLNAGSVGEAYPYARLGQVALNVPGVANAQSILLNGGTADLGGGSTQAVRSNAASVAVA